jgi:hypothetical protein
MNNLRRFSDGHGFESHPRLQDSRFKSMDYNLRFFSRFLKLGTFGNNWGKSSLQNLNCAPMCIRNRVSVKVQRGRVLPASSIGEKKRTKA